MTITPVLLCGGSGTRLWPLSRKSYPKQFARLTGDESLFQASARRLSGPGFAAPVIVTGEPFRFIVTEQLAAVEQAPQAILIEPEGRNTGPAVLAAALHLAATDPDALMLVAPSDHVIPDVAAFRDCVAAAAVAARNGDLVTFGIAPTRPETGYGYLELADGTQTAAGTPQSLARFVEKPDSAAAGTMLAQGGYLWNAGIFLFSAKTAIAAFRAHAPDLVAPVEQALSSARLDLGFTRLAAEPWSAAADISIDYAIMEKAANLAVMPYGAGWSDLGGWDAVWMESGPDAAGNVTSDHATAIDCRDTLLRSESAGLEVVGIGLDDITVVAMPDAVLVAHKSQSQRVKEAVASLGAKGVSQAVQLPRDYRPWGWYESLIVGGAVPGQADPRAPRRVAEPAVPPSPVRTLDRGRGHRAGDRGRERAAADREPVGLYPAGCGAPDGKPRQGCNSPDRGADRSLPGRGRHRALRRHLRPHLTPPGGRTSKARDT